MSDDANGVKRLLWGQAGSVIVAVLVQSGVLIWWAACMTTRLNYVERDLTSVTQRVYQLEIDKP